MPISKDLLQLDWHKQEDHTYYAECMDWQLRVVRKVFYWTYQVWLNGEEVSQGIADTVYLACKAAEKQIPLCERKFLVW